MAKVIYLDGINVIDLAQGQEKNKAGGKQVATLSG